MKINEFYVEQKDFVLTVENPNSPILITVPHGGIKNEAGAWLDLFFKKRIKYENPKENYINGEKIVIGGDTNIMHVVAEILNYYPANLVFGLLPREFVDYNRFVPEVAYEDTKIKPFYDAYHASIDKILGEWPRKVLFDFHGFGKQPDLNVEYDIIFGTCNGTTTPGRLDQILYGMLKKKYKVFCCGVDGMRKESEMYTGDTTNLHYFSKYGTNSMLIELSPKFRSSRLKDSKEQGKFFAEYFGVMLSKIHTRFFEQEGLDTQEELDKFFEEFFKEHKERFCF